MAVAGCQPVVANRFPHALQLGSMFESYSPTMQSMREFDAAGNEKNPRPRSPMADYQDFGSGLRCRVCGAMVPADDRFAAAHTEWHRLGR